MRFEDLDARDQREIRSGFARPNSPGPKGGPGPRSRPSRDPGPPLSHRCARCGETFGRYPLAERHADEQHEGATRIEVVL